MKQITLPENTCYAVRPSRSREHKGDTNIFVSFDDNIYVLRQGIKCRRTAFKTVQKIRERRLITRKFWKKLAGSES